MAREEGPTLTMAAREEAHADDGGRRRPPLTMARDDSPTLTMARRRGAPRWLAARCGQAGGAADPAGREGDRLEPAREGPNAAAIGGAPRAFRWRRNAGAWIVAAATNLLAAVTLGAAHRAGQRARARRWPPGRRRARTRR